MFRSKEQETFYKTICLHQSKLDGPLLLEGGTGLGKTRAYLKALVDYGQKTAIVFPSHQLIDQLLQSQDLKAVGAKVKAFRPTSFFDAQDTYLEANEAAKEADIMLCTSASVMIDQMLQGGYNGIIERAYIIFDEADGLPQDAALQQDLTILDAEISAFGLENRSVLEILQQLSVPSISADLRARARLIKKAHSNPKWYYTVGKNSIGDLELNHRMPGLLLSTISNQANVAFVSATLSISNSFDDFKRSLGIKTTSIYSRQIDPEHHGNLKIHYPKEQTVETIVEGAKKPCLVVPPSFEDAEALAKLLPNAIVRERKESSAMAAERVQEEGVLIATGAWAGLDTPIRWASVVVPRIPFGKPTELDGKTLTHYISSRNLAVRRMRQVIGRGLRTPDSRCDFYICDKRYSQLGNFLPTRFKASWKEGAKKTYELTKFERDPSLRREALKFYEFKCYCCDKRPKIQSMIEIHHLNPIAQGERETKVEDVLPLCRNCHSAAHSEEPPIPIERLKVMDLWKVD